MNKIALFGTKKVSLFDVVAYGQSRAAKKAVKKAALQSIEDQENMSKKAKLLHLK